MILLINSCKADRENGKQDVNLCWIREWEGVPYRFVLGRGNDNPRRDELIVDVPDAYQNMPDKHQAACAWALQNDSGYAVLTCTDTYVHVGRLLSSVGSSKDYTGHKIPNERYASGGAGFVLSPAAQRLVVAAKLGGTGFGDKWVGEAVVDGGLSLHHDPRFCPTWSAVREDAITVHMSKTTGNFDPQWMLDLHKKIGHLP